MTTRWRGRTPRTGCRTGRARHPSSPPARTRWWRMPAPADLGAALELDLELTPDQELLRDTSRRCVEHQPPLPRVGPGAEGGAELEKDYVTAAAELGWFAMFAPEEYG